MESSPFQEGQVPTPSDARYTDGSSRDCYGNSTETEKIWFDAGVGQSSQWAGLRAAWLVASNEAPPQTICTDSWAVYQGLTSWISTWHTNKWMVMHRPLWGQALWQDLWELGPQKRITVCHVTGRAPLASPGNDEADTPAKVWWLEMVPASLSGQMSPSGYTVTSYMLGRRHCGLL